MLREMGRKEPGLGWILWVGASWQGSGGKEGHRAAVLNPEQEGCDLLAAAEPRGLPAISGPGHLHC